jgi:DNA polymerase III alpha subunit (gram-positive type)
MLILGFDTETTGLNVHEDHIIEVGAVLWDTDRKAPMYTMSALIKGSHIPKLEAKITELTGIKDEDLATFGHDVVGVLQGLNNVIARAEAIVAHNGNLFDKPMYESNCKRHGVEIVQKPWIDTSCDVEFPPHITTRRLSHLAADHGFLNPFAHRALFDVMTMLKVMSEYNFEQILTWSKAPTVELKADSTFQQKELVKKQNYRWDNERKIWHKSIKAFQLDDARKAAKEAGFGVSVLKGAGK